MVALGALVACEAPPSLGPPPGIAPADVDPWGGRLSLGNEIECQAPAAGLPGYEDVTEQAGVAFQPQMPEWDEGANGITSVMMEAVGGFAIADLNGDNALDLVFTAFDALPRLYLNLGALQFELVEAEISGLLIEGIHLNAVSAVDLDGDGDLDLHFGSSDGARIFINDGQALFTDATDDAGLGCTGNILGSTWADVDGDGDLDGYVLGYGPGSPAPDVPFENDPDILYENNAGLFVERTGTMHPKGQADGQGFAAGWFDSDGNGRQDLYVVNDGGAWEGNPRNRYFANNGEWTFTDLKEGADVGMLSMGLAIGDMDNDGDMDLHVSDAGPTLLLRNDGDHVFTDVSLALAGFSDGSEGDISWGTTFLDHDMDGVLELATAYGYMPTKSDEGPEGTLNRQEMPDQLWVQDDQGWRDVAPELGVADPSWTRTILSEDLDGDGFAELITWSMGGGPRIYRSGCNSNS